jgi:hypothetical protein
MLRDQLELTTRDPKGTGRVEAHCQSGSLLGLEELTILVHGYNTSECKANVGWARTIALLRREGLEPHRPTNIGRFYWPGDEPSPVRSAASYPQKVAVAALCGQSLAKLLNATVDPGSRLDVSFVGHSLGCKVVLEAAKCLHGNARVVVRDVLLMAAAVPVGLCEPPRLYAVKTAATQRVLWSQEDDVLGFKFRLGQMLARRMGDPPPGRNRAAVGRTGGPRFTGRWDASPQCDLRHGQYWDCEEPIYEIGRLIGAVTPQTIAKRKSITRTLPEWELSAHTLDRCP